jgi:phosphoglycolate phosphatase-like HAD superfamily hydrolase|tara:strand:+ start:215 stop:823 length:609 start_codon:yes stop_codon:yes gene_type:complete
MPVRVIVFDFDGTLIDSNQLKYDAFFKLFPSDDLHKKIVTEVLSEILEGSRYVILRETIKRRNTEMNEGELDNNVQVLAAKYNVIVTDGAKHCKEKPGAKEVLESLSKRYNLYLNSTTPETSLKDIVKHRKWENYFCDIFGYPNDKTSVLLDIIKTESINPDELLVVGDGKSDMDSSKRTGCKFFPINRSNSLQKLLYYYNH